MSKPREFWVAECEYSIGVVENEIKPGDEFYDGYNAQRMMATKVTHVIEKSAYTRACQEVLRLEGLRQQNRLDIQTLQKERDELKQALVEFDTDENWLCETDYIDRPSKTRSDWVYIGKWDPRVFATHAIKGTPLANTKPEERRGLSDFYKPNAVITNLCKERDSLKSSLASRDKMLEKLLRHAKALAEAIEEWPGMYENTKYAAILDSFKKEYPTK